MDERIGKIGDYSPTKTISGEQPEPAMPKRGIGEGYYVILDYFPAVDVDAEIKKLIDAKKKKTSAKKKVETDEQ